MIKCSFFSCFVLLNVEVFDFVGLLILGNHVKKFSKAVLLEIFLGKILKVPLWERHSAVYANLCSVVSNFNLISEFSCFTINFDSLAQVFWEVGGDEDLILHWLWAVDTEVEDFVFFLFFCYDLGFLHDAVINNQILIILIIIFLSLYTHIYNILWFLSTNKYCIPVNEF